MPKYTIAVHQSPDFDCIGAAWLLETYDGMADAEIVFLNTGNPDPAVLESADAVVDTGRVLDPATRRFDHHQLTSDASQTSATMQVYEYLLQQGMELEWLRPLIELINAADLGRDDCGADSSRQFGMHMLLGEMKYDKASDQEMLRYGYWLLDRAAQRLERRNTAKSNMYHHMVYMSDDRRLIALKGADQGATFVAYEQGYDVVLFQGESETPQGTSYSIGVMRKNGTAVNVGDLVRNVLDGGFGATRDEYTELGRWYLHEAGFFGGRGTAKAPVYEPVTVDLARIALLLDSVWYR